MPDLGRLCGFPSSAEAAGGGAADGAPAERIAQNGWHIDYGILGSKYVLNMLGEYGRTDVIYKMLTREDYPGYLYWVDHGCTTLAECWNLGGSHNHYMFSDVSAVFYRYFAGIRPDGGHSRIPQLPAGARAGFGHRHAFVQCGKPARHYFLQVGKRTGTR